LDSQPGNFMRPTRLRLPNYPGETAVEGAGGKNFHHRDTKNEGIRKMSLHAKGLPR
jgi:hypothetical protein